MKDAFWATVTLWQREMVRFYRQPSRVIGAMASPLVFWLLLGSGIGTSFKSKATGAASYLQYFFPGTLLMVLFFTAVFSTISIIEDRREGFLQSVLVAPIPRSSFVLGKILGGTSLALIQALFFLVFAPFIGCRLSALNIFEIAVALFLNAFFMTGLGFLIAWRFNSIQGFHAVMNLFLMPMWMLSGALFPEEGASPWILWIMRVNPLTYGMNALRAPFLDGGGSLFLNSSLLTGLFGILVFAGATFSASARNPGDFK